jgi:hypothetical protein
MYILADNEKSGGNPGGASLKICARRPGEGRQEDSTGHATIMANMCNRFEKKLHDLE